MLRKREEPEGDPLDLEGFNAIDEEKQGLLQEISHEKAERTKSCYDAFKILLSSSPFNILLIFVPVAMIAKYCKWSNSIVFFSSLIALCPLAERLSFVTEILVWYTNSSVGGLINATFGNMTEMIIAFVALKKGKFWVVQVSLLGSIFSNALLVLGTAFLVGGLKFETQTFNKTAANANAMLLLVSVVALVIPSVLDAAGDVDISDNSVLTMSRIVSIGLVITYGLFLYFQLKTHAHLFDDEEDEEKDEIPMCSLYGCLVTLAFVTFFIAVLSEILVDVIEEASDSVGIPPMFVGTILLPFAGNACEHAGAVVFAAKNKMAVSLGIALGSSVQVAFFVIPMSVLAAWLFNLPMSLDFKVFQSVTVLLTTLLVSLVVRDGRSNWLMGSLLILSYFVIGAGYWVHKSA